MKRVDKVKLLIRNEDFCIGLNIESFTDEEKMEYLQEGFSDRDINTFYYEFIDMQ